MFGNLVKTEPLGALNIENIGDSKRPTLLKLALYVEGLRPDQPYLVLCMPAELARQEAGFSLKTEFGPIIAGNDEGAYKDVKQGRWGKYGDVLCQWVSDKVFPKLISPHLNDWGAKSANLWLHSPNGELAVGPDERRSER